MNKEIKDLIKGYENFKKNYLVKQEKQFNDLIEFGQKPKTLIIACSDSRVDPAIITSSLPGDLFVVRNIANLVPPFENDHLYHHGTSAALEFGVKFLKVKNIIILGHSHCGGIKSILTWSKNQLDNTDFISDWMDIAKPAKEKVLKAYPEATLEKQSHLCEKESLLISYNNLKTFPWIEEAVANNQLFLHAWYFNLKTKIIETYDEKKDKFIMLKNTPD